MSKKMGRKKGGGRRVKRSGSSAESCRKVLDKCGVSTTVCNDADGQAIAKARKKSAEVRKEAAKWATANIKAATDLAAAHRRAQLDAMKACRKTLSVAQHMKATIAADPYKTYMNAFGRRRVRRSR